MKRTHLFRTGFFMLLAWIFFCGAFSPVASAGEVTLFAAASTTNAITDIGKLFSQKGLGTVTPSFASSSTLAKQIDKGAPAEMYLSANTKWMNYLAEKGLIDDKSRFDLLSNRLVLIVPAGSDIREVAISRGMDLAGLLGDAYLATGDPDHVPAGIYGKQALESLGLWESIDDRIARQKDVRSALALVERGESPLGVVYATDAAISKKVRVVGIFPAESHPKIVYPVAIVKGGDTGTAAALLEFLKSPEARAVFESYGFSMAE